jgi:hypothetical protein
VKLTRYYVTGRGVTIGPFFRRKAAEQFAAGRGFSPALDPLSSRALGGCVVTRAELKARRPSPAGLSETDLIAYARAHVTSPGALALLDEVERGRERRDRQT